jgi:hypothetical protein
MKAAAAFALCACVLLAQEPYKDAKKSPPAYHGPGREDPEPEGLNDVRIAYFGSTADTVWEGISRAIEEANREGGYRGLPFRIVPAWSENPWAGGVSSLARLVFQDRVWAILGSIDGAGTHLAEQVVAKALLPLINPVATDRSVHQAGLAWVFSVVPGDHAIAPVLARELPAAFTLISATDHYSRAFVSQLKANPALHLEFEPGRLPDLLGVHTGGVLLIAGPRDSAQVLNTLRAGGFCGTVYGGPWMGRRTFREEAAAGGIVFPVLGEAPPGFSDYAAAHAYDATRLLVAAIRKAGLNRARIRDAIQELSPYRGVTGEIRWDQLGQNARPARLAEILGTSQGQCE